MFTDTDEICVFLREPLKEPDFAEEEELEPEKEVRFLEKESETVATEISRVRPFPDCEESWEIEDTVIPFRTPPKTESGDTIE